MSAFMLSLFYIYVIFAINYYRKEINYRISNGYSGKIKAKFKAPFSLRKSVLLSIVAVGVNTILQIISGVENVILINAVPVAVFMLVLRRYERKLIKMEKE